MKHVEIATREADPDAPSYGSKSLEKKSKGEFFTHKFIAERLSNEILKRLDLSSPAKPLRIVEPFCGDGGLICKLLVALASNDSTKACELEIVLWDCSKENVKTAKKRVASQAKELGITAKVAGRTLNTFFEWVKEEGQFDICITNPPWEVLKPDRREQQKLSPDDKEKYVEALRELDRRLTKGFPTSAPSKRFSGWGLNLSRCGTELSARLLKPGGVLGIVTASSLLADQSSENLRDWIFRNNRVQSVEFYVAETKLFEGVDQPFITFVLKNDTYDGVPPKIVRFDRTLNESPIKISRREWKSVADSKFRLPLQFGIELLSLNAKWNKLPRLNELEKRNGGSLWLGRELDETNHRSFISESGQFAFVKGRNVDRYSLNIPENNFVNEELRKVPVSAGFKRVAWRDISRPSQVRRVKATVLPEGVVTGNSLHVGYFGDGNEEKLNALLAILNSLVAEAQVRMVLSTNHISLGAMRNVHLPELADQAVNFLSRLVRRVYSHVEGAEEDLEIAVALEYGISRSELLRIASVFPGLDQSFVKEIGSGSRWGRVLMMKSECGQKQSKQSEKSESAPNLANHRAGRMSDLDLQVARAVPEGGNWKNIPESVPSKRLEQIRASYARGEGSRSTYYGRLRRDCPAYTINTYFNRPGNGCHLHYDERQNRTLTPREAARIQTFPDSFVFSGTAGSILKQIGNAVPPLLAYQLAMQLNGNGGFVDLFAGAGGLGYGFKMAGWEPIVGSDIEKYFLGTYKENVCCNIVCGDIREGEILAAILEKISEWRKANRNRPLIILGGPPCQGFSTAGKRRSMKDERNQLFYDFKEVLLKARPDAFLFENVTGLLNMDKGRIFDLVKGELSEACQNITAAKIQTELYGVPQRRSRVIIFGSNQSGIGDPLSLPELTSSPSHQLELEPRPNWISVEEALSDLPPLEAGEDGSQFDYRSEARTPFQQLMRSEIMFGDYVSMLKLES